MVVQRGKFEFGKSERSFRFGAGPLIHSSGTIIIFIHVGENCIDSTKPLASPVCLDLVVSNVPLLISHESLRKMKGSLDFPEASFGHDFRNQNQIGPDPARTFNDSRSESGN